MTLKKLENRYLFDELYEELLEIINMDIATLMERIKPYEKDQLFQLQVDEVLFVVNIKDQHIQYKYAQSTNKNDKLIVLDSDVDQQRMKGALCAVKVRNFYHEIPSMAIKGEKSLSFEYVSILEWQYRSDPIHKRNVVRQSKALSSILHIIDVFLLTVQR